MNVVLACRATFIHHYDKGHIEHCTLKHYAVLTGLMVLEQVPLRLRAIVDTVLEGLSLRYRD